MHNLLFVLFLNTVTGAAPDKELFAKWAKIKAAAPGPSQAIGAYDAGCLAGADKLEPNGKGYALMRPVRKRYFGHPDLNLFLKTLGEILHGKKMPILLVGDASPPRGGPMLSGHASHQTGLDVDLWLKMSSQRPNSRQRASWGATSFVKDRKILRKNWSKTQTNLIAHAASIPSVNRIFVSPAIKKHLCATMSESEWLYKIRAWWGHEEHIHVRLNCPAENTACTSQAALNPNDNGCGAELDWWFSKEADEEWTKIQADRKPREFPQLPEACQSLVN